jgi:nuclear GTP-binding protein
LKKDPGIPNLFPYKEKLLQEIEEKKRLREEEVAEQKAQSKAAIHNSSANIDIMSEDDDDELYDEENDFAEGDVDMTEDINPMAALLASARERASEFDGGVPQGDAMQDDEEEEWNGVEEDDGTYHKSSLKKDTSRKSFDKIFKEVVDMADVVLYVLDARDPEGTRSREVERAIMTAKDGDKRLILILNKIDLVPQQVVKGWLTHLRRYFPTLPLRASKPASNAKIFDHKQMSVKGTSEALFRALKSYAESKQLKRAVSVGVIGYPNVGKSSVINALSSRLRGGGNSCPVGAEAGVTTSKREVKLDNKLKLIDCPGIVFPSSISDKKLSKTEQQARLVLLNAVPPKELDDPVPAVKLLLQRLSSSPSLLQALYDGYGLPELMKTNGDDTLTDFLVQVARKKGRIGKGGIPSTHGAAQAVITDWRDGRIQGWMDPPGVDTSDANSGLVEAAPEGDTKIIVREWAAEFKLDGLFGDDAPERIVEETAMVS